MQNKHPPTGRRRPWPFTIALYAGIAAGALVLVCVLALLIFTDPLVNKFIKPKITKVLAEAYPEYSIRSGEMHYSVFTNRFGFDSVSVRASDHTLSGSVNSFSVSGISWLHLLWGGNLSLDDFTDAAVDARDIMVDLPKSQYRVRSKRLRASIPESEIVAESMELHPLGGDEQFYLGSAFRKARLILVTSQCRVEGLEWMALLQGNNYTAHSVQIRDAFFDVMVNKDKPDARDTKGPFMPNEFLSLIKKPFRIDHLNLVNGRLKYFERFELDRAPAVIVFDDMNVSAEGIANRGERGSTFVVRAQTKFANAGTMKLTMTFPIASPDFSFHYSGSLSGMNLDPLNSFLEVSDHMRIKEGVLEGVTYEINVTSGRAVGTVTGTYRNLSIAAINKNTGSEKGFSDRVKSFLANTFKIRRNNVAGEMKIGKIHYVRQPDDPFFQYAWFSLRTGVQDVLGI